MITYNDLLQETDKKAFVRRVIDDHKSSIDYKMAKVADEYNRRLNRTILNYQKLLYTMSGRAVPDNYSANYKLCSNFFSRFVTQENQYLLGNGVTWNDDKTAEKLGGDFDNKLQEAGENALVHKIAFGFWNMDHVEVFSFLEFAPLWDEEDGALKAGVRFWQIDANKPLRATLYELDGYTDYIWRQDKPDGEILNEKRAYKLTLKGTDADGMEIFNGENYPTFPIVPLWGNKYHQSEFVGMRENIDAYDLIKSGFANDLDDASQIYWTIQNGGGMDDVDLAKFIERMKTVKAAVVEDGGASAESHTMEVPYAAREAVLNRIRSDLYEDFMALDTKNLAAGAVTATQIQAAYEPLNQKADKYEFCVIEFIKGILDLAGIEDDPTFTRSVVVNTTETINNVLAGAQYLSEDYVTRKILTVLGDGDQADQIMKEMDGENMARFSGNPEGTQEENPEENDGEA